MTTPEAVAARLRESTKHGEVSCAGLCLEAAAMLEALAAERDRLLDERGEYEKEMAQETIEAEARATAAESALEAVSAEYRADTAALRDRARELQEDRNMAMDSGADTRRELAAARADAARLRAALADYMERTEAMLAANGSAEVVPLGLALPWKRAEGNARAALAAPAAGSPPAETT